MDSRALPCPLFKVAEILGLDGDGGERGRSLEHGARQEVQLQGTPVLFLKEADGRQRNKSPKRCRGYFTEGNISSRKRKHHYACQIKKRCLRLLLLILIRVQTIPIRLFRGPMHASFDQRSQHLIMLK